MTPQYNRTMKVWGWFAASALWLVLIAAARFDFVVGVQTGKYIPRRLALGFASTLMHLIFFGWIIPLFIGLWRLTLRLTHRS
jgi:hypothetical protein